MPTAVEPTKELAVSESMSESVEPEPRRFKCTYKDCLASFASEAAMKSHKKNSEEHDYCKKCDKDFKSYEDLAQHKVIRPDKHGRACRVCGAEFKSTSGLRRHIELNHAIDQKLPCLGCGEEFYRASLLVEHIEFGHCSVITPEQFLGHIVHRHLVTDLLKGGAAYDRFMQKISKFDAAQDFEDQGGVTVNGNDTLEAEEGEAGKVEFEAIKPEQSVEEQIPDPGPFPPLPTRNKARDAASDLVSSLERTSIGGQSGSTTACESASGEVEGSAKTSTSNRQLKVWTGGAGKQLFPDAKPTPPPTEFSISDHDQQMSREHGINVMKTRFWDPWSDDWNPERFYDTITCLYFCPFICEQTFPNPVSMNEHIINEHRITRMKCPTCLKYFKCVTALMAHCESRGAKCQINKADNYNLFLDKLTGGFLSVEEKTRPDHLHNPAVLVENPELQRVERYTPPTASYLRYSSSKPADWKDPKEVAAQIGGGPASGTFDYQGSLARW